MRNLFILLTATLAFSACDTVKYNDYAEFQAKQAEPLGAYEDWLTRYGLIGIVSTQGLVKSASDWRKCRAQAWAVPPSEYWPEIAPALYLIRDGIKPLVGPVTVESGWRAPEINECVGGAARSKHVLYQALDLVPVDEKVTREALIERLCAFWAEQGERWRMGLGIYSGRRFHVDTGGWRTWGPDYSAKTSPCVEREAPDGTATGSPGIAPSVTSG